jgi:hypothetical protein
LTDPTTMGVDPSDENPLTKLVGGALNSLATLPQRAIQNSQYSLDTGNYDPSVPVETALTMMGGSGAMPAEANSLRMGIKAYHGSPHDFDAFDLSKIGTGEGAQAYGHGLYFADNEGVAKSYRDALAPPSVIDNGGVKINAQSSGPERQAYFTLRSANGDFDKAIVGAKSAMNADDVQNVLKGWRDNAATIDHPGHMYEVNINADPEHFLDWDKPLSEQPANVQQAFKSVGVDPTAPNLRDQVDAARGLRLHPPQGGSAVYPHELPDMKSPQATAALSKAGIPGIKYLDQGSRAAGDGSRNYVVFNDKLVDIIKKYGMAGISMLPPAMAAEVSKYVKPVDHDPFEGT